jgi:uncharacterized DUF497 family protein
VAITYDPRKRASNLEKHGVDFADAGEVFAGFGLTEARYVTIGRLRGREVVVVWTQRGDDQRIISMRPADEKERAYFRQRLSEAGRDDG